MVLEHVLLELDTANNKIYKILTDTILNAVIIDYATDSTKAGSWQARAVAKQVYGKDLPYIYLLPELEEGARTYVTNSESKGDSETNSIEGALSKSGNKGLKIYPNPSRNNFNLIYYSDLERTFSYFVIDVLGKEVKSGVLNANVKQEISADMLNNGIYFITLIQKGKVVEKQKLIIMK